MEIFATAGAIGAEFDRLRAAAQATDQSVQGCSLDDGVRASWGLFYANLMTFVNRKPVNFLATGDNEVLVTGSLSNETAKNGQQLLAWQKTIEAKGCSLTTPIYNPQPPPEPAAEWMKLLALGVATVSGAYVVGKVVSIIPTATQRERARSRPAALQAPSVAPRTRRSRRPLFARLAQR